MSGFYLFNENDLVRFTSAEKHKEYPNTYPRPGTIGEIKKVSDRSSLHQRVMVQWPQGSTSDDDLWGCNAEYLELVSR